MLLLLLPLEGFVLQHMLGPRWEKEALALLGEGAAWCCGHCGVCTAVVLQHMLGPRWEKGALALLG